MLRRDRTLISKKHFHLVPGQTGSFTPFVLRQKGVTGSGRGAPGQRHRITPAPRQGRAPDADEFVRHRATERWNVPIHLQFGMGVFDFAHTRNRQGIVPVRYAHALCHGTVISGP